MVECVVLTAPGPVWDAAVRQAEVIGRLAGTASVGLAVADEAAAELGVSRRQVYVLVGRWRAGEGVVSDLLPGPFQGPMIARYRSLTTFSGGLRPRYPAGGTKTCEKRPGGGREGPQVGWRPGGSG